MPELVFFDAACQVGRNERGEGEELSTLLSDMKKFGVSKALVSHYPQASLGAVCSNRILADMLKQPGTENLLGVWCILPQQCHELPPPDQFFAEMKQNRIGAVMMDPFNHRWYANRLTIGHFMEEAKKRRVPVVLNSFCGHWEQLYDLLETFPDNVYILSYPAKWGIDRQVRPLIEAYKGVHFCIGGYWQPMGIRHLAEEYGADRLLFSSAFPVNYAGSAMLQLKHSGLDEESVAKIASGNLERILKGAEL